MDYALVSFFILLVILPTLLKASSVTPPHQDIWRHLMKNYDSRIRPVLHPDTVLNVSMNIHVNNVIDLDAKNQNLLLKLWIVMYWYDEFLKFNGSYGLNYVEGKKENVWVPDIVLYESVDREHPGIIDHPILRLRSSGLIKWVPVVVTISSCKFSVRDYPFDIQECPLTFGSWVHNNKDIHLIWNNTLYDDKVFVTSGEWDVAPLKCEVEEEEYGNEMFDHLKCKLVLTRRPLHYIVNLVLPCLVLLLVGSFTFLLPVNSGEKVNLAITILLALTVFVIFLMDNLPANSDGIPFLGRFIAVCIILLGVSTAMAVSIVHMVARGNEEIGGSLPPYWLEFLVLRCLRKVVCYSSKNIHDTAVRARELSLRRRSFYPPVEMNINNHSPVQDQDEGPEKNKKSAQIWIEIATVIDRLYLIVYLLIELCIIVAVIEVFTK